MLNTYIVELYQYIVIICTLILKYDNLIPLKDKCLYQFPDGGERRREIQVKSVFRVPGQELYWVLLIQSTAR